MKKLLSLWALLFLPALPMSAGETAAVVVSGEPRGSAQVLRADKEIYLDARTVGRALGAQVYWYPVSGRVRMTLRGRSLQFVAGSTKASSGRDALILPAPLRVSAGRAYLPVSFLVSPAFGRWSGTEARFEPQGMSLSVERRSDVGPVHAFSYQGRTRVIVELAPGVSYRTAPRGSGAAELTVPLGAADEEMRVRVDDGVVSSYRLRQDRHQARLTVYFAAKDERWRATELSDPRGVAIDIFAPGTEPVLPPVDRGRKRVIVIDAGHGGKDTGASGRRGTLEKDVNLVEAMELARVLRARGDFQVVLTRQDDVFVPLADRSERANSLDADLFVSLHCNAASNRRERGFEVYSISETASDPEAERLAATENASLKLEGKNPQDETAHAILLAMTKTEMINESAPLAVLVERALARRLDIPDRGAKQAAFYVLRGTHAPAVLVEVAFLSHAKEEALLHSRAFRRKAAEAIAAGIADYARSKGWL